jgi:hypothetical protein
MEVTICSHYPKNLKKEELVKALQNFDNATCCAEIHKTNPEIKSGKPEELWTCLTTLKNLCGRSTQGKCMLKYRKETEGCAVVASFKKNQIWCYECDDSAQNIIQQAKLFNENSHEDQELLAYESFFAEVSGAFVDVRLAGRGESQPKTVDLHA